MNGKTVEKAARRERRTIKEIKTGKKEEGMELYGIVCIMTSRV